MELENGARCPKNPSLLKATCSHCRGLGQGTADNPVYSLKEDNFRGHPVVETSWPTGWAVRALRWAWRGPVWTGRTWLSSGTCRLLQQTLLQLCAPLARLQALVRRRDTLEQMRQQERNRLESAEPAVAVQDGLGPHPQGPVYARRGGLASQSGGPGSSASAGRCGQAPTGHRPCRHAQAPPSGRRRAQVRPTFHPCHTRNA